MCFPNQRNNDLQHLITFPISKVKTWSEKQEEELLVWDKQVVFPSEATWNVSGSATAAVLAVWLCAGKPAICCATSIPAALLPVGSPLLSVWEN